MLREPGNLDVAVEAGLCVDPLELKKADPLAADFFGPGDEDFRTVLPRQRTLRALIDWSYRLLDEPRRLLFQRLAVFAGGFSLEDAEAVCGASPLAADEVMDLLASLVEESLVVLQADGQTYAMLETVRAYALELFDSSSEAASIRDAHLVHYLALAEQARRDLFTPREAAWMQRLDALGAARE